MPLCGFNEKMLKGLKDFAEGSLEHGIIDRSKRNNLSIEEQFTNEFMEMDIFLKESENINKPYLRNQIIGATLLAKGIYEENSKNISNYVQTTGHMVNLFRDMDNHFYNNLKGDYRRMSELIDWLNKKNKKITLQ